ncbi:MAG: endonuclease [SAR202 cluster bacterium]|nr:endonuclease [SAR202 cluster bacterium]
MRSKLLEVYQLLLGQYSPQHWWPSDTPFEMMVGAILTQSAAWTNVEKAIANLKKEDALSPSAIRALPEPELAQLVRPSGYYNAKARKLKAMASFLWEEYGDDPRGLREDGELLREKLLKVYGIGEETADDIALYVGGIATFVVDAYTRRLVLRLGVFSEDKPYETYRRLFMENLPADVAMFGEYHALIVRHAKEACRKTAPRCGGCVLRRICDFGKSSGAA